MSKDLYNKKNRRTGMRYVALLFLILTACWQSDNPYDNIDYRHGTQGLEIDFDKSLPARVYEGSYMNLVLELRNKGAYDIRPGYGMVYLSGYDPSAIGFSTDRMPLPEVLGKNAYMPDGGYELIEWDERETVKVPFTDTYTPTLMATSCYTYQTLATPTVCVLSNPQDILQDDVCTPDTITMSSQGAPVAVTKVEEQILQQQLNFIITVENVGDGNVIARESLQKCPFDLMHTDMNQVDVKVMMSTGGEVACTPSNRIRLVDGKGVIFCTMDVEIETSYTSPLIIQLDYAYSSSTKQTIEITKPPGTSSPGLPTSPPISSSSGDIDPGIDTGVNDKGGCPCDISSYTPCVCLYIGGMRHDCGYGDPSGYDRYVSPGTYTVSVDGSSSKMDSCRIVSGSSQDSGPCGSTSITLDLRQERTVSVFGYINGQLVASQDCRLTPLEDPDFP